jgi:ferrous iron transport protein B
MSVIALAGNPNCGKTTLFNRLTNSRYRVGNRAGVTVEPKQGKWGLHTVVDLPGVYSLSESTAEECAARNYLLTGKASRILNIIDAANLERSLWLTVQLARLCIPMTVVLNMADQLEKSGYKIDIEKLAKRIGVPVILISASKGDGMQLLAAAGAGIPNEISEPRKWISETVSEVLYSTGDNIPIERSIKIDKIVLGRFSLPILVIVMGMVFWLTFGYAGRTLGGLCEIFFLKITMMTEEILTGLNVNCFLKSLVCDGVLQSIGGIIPFFGQILILFSCLSFLEDIGYMSRAVFAADSFMSKYGLDGKAFLPLVTGLGCSVPAVMTAQNIDDREKRERTVRLLPFFPCSAKMPVFIIFCTEFFKEHAAAAVAGLYILGIGAAFVYAKIREKEYSEKTPFVLELPPYRKPTLRNTLNQLREKLADFLKRAGSVLFIAGIAVWILENFDFSLHMTNDAEKSILGIIGKAAAPLFAPCGFGTWQAAVSLMSGFMAKEAVISTLSVVYGTKNFLSAFTPASAASFLVFVLIYPPCFAALSAISTEISRKRTLKLIAEQFFAAWMLSAVVYFVFSRCI